MKSLVRLTAPNDHEHRGAEVYINPDDVVTVRKSQRGDCVVVVLRNGDRVFDSNTISKVVADIEAAL